MRFAIENSFFLNSLMDASDLNYLIHFQEAYGFSLRCSIKVSFFINYPLFLEPAILLASYSPLVLLFESD